MADGAPVVVTDRLLLRNWRDSDRDAFWAINADPRVTEHLGSQTREGCDAAVDRQIALTAQGQPCFWAAEARSDGALMGFIGVKPLSFVIPGAAGYEIGWRLGAAYWGSGYASEGARAALAHAFATLPVGEIFAITVPANLRSQAVMRRIGMERVEGGDFDHPLLAEGDPLRRHLLYRINRPAAAR